MTPAEQCAICGPSKHALRLKIDELASAACALREALQKTRDILANRTNCGQFCRPVDHAGCARCDMFAALNDTARPCPHQPELERLKSVIHEWEESDRARVLLGPTLAEAVADVGELRVLCGEAAETIMALALQSPTAAKSRGCSAIYAHLMVAANGKG